MLIINGNPSVLFSREIDSKPYECMDFSSRRCGTKQPGDRKDAGSQSVRRTSYFYFTDMSKNGQWKRSAEA